MQRNVAGCCREVSVIMTGAITLAGAGALITVRFNQFIGFMIEQSIECLLDAASDKIFKIVLYQILVQLYNVIRHGAKPLSRRKLCVVTQLYRAVIDHVYLFMILRNLLYLIRISAELAGNLLRLMLELSLSAFIRLSIFRCYTPLDTKQLSNNEDLLNEVLKNGIKIYVYND